MDDERRRKLLAAWEQIARTHDRNATLPATLVEHSEYAGGSWIVDVLGVRALLRDTSVLEPTTPPATWREGDAVEVRVLKYDRGLGFLELWMRPG